MKILGINIIILLLVITQPASALINGDSISTEHEETLQIEDWMLEELNPCQESECLLEDWMFLELSPRQEAEFGLEDWMYESLFPEATEEKVRLEDWMFK